METASIEIDEEMVLVYYDQQSSNCVKSILALRLLFDKPDVAEAEFNGDIILETSLGGEWHWSNPWFSVDNGVASIPLVLSNAAAVELHKAQWLKLTTISNGNVISTRVTLRGSSDAFNKTYVACKRSLGSTSQPTRAETFL